MSKVAQMSDPIIKQINLQLFKLNFRQPIITSNQSIRSRTGIIIQVIDQFGNVGWGESSPLAGFGEGIIYTARSLKRIQKLLIGVAIASLADISSILASHNLPPVAKFGIELALLNLLALNHQKSLAQLLHTHYRPSILINGLIGQVSPEVAAQQTQQLCALGYTCLKVKVGDTQDLQRVRAVRSTADAFTRDYRNIKIRIDANQAWTVSEAIQKLKEFTELDIEYVEQPVNADNLTGMAEVCNSVEIAIAADESVRNMDSLLRVIQTQAASIVILKPMALGGILTAKTLAKVAIESGLDVVFTTTLDSAIAQTGALHLAAMPEIKRACGLGSTLFTDELFTPEEFSRGNKFKQLLTQESTVVNGEIVI